MRVAKEPFEDGDFRIEQTERGHWWVYQYATWCKPSWSYTERFKYRWQARRYIRKEIAKTNRMPRQPEYWRA